MRKSLLIAAAFACWPIAAYAQPATTPAPGANAASDATAFVTGIIDKFNAGDTKSFLAAHEDDALIVDDFGQHVWMGKGTAQRWLNDYMKQSASLGDTGGHMDYGKPIASNAEGNSVYIVMPTTYRYVEKGTKMAGTGSMTFVVKRDGKGWKVASWTYSGATPVPEK